MHSSHHNKRGGKGGGGVVLTMDNFGSTTAGSQEGRHLPPSSIAEPLCIHLPHITHANDPDNKPCHAGSEILRSHRDLLRRTDVQEGANKATRVPSPASPIVTESSFMGHTAAAGNFVIWCCVERKSSLAFDIFLTKMVTMR